VILNEEKLMILVDIKRAQLWPMPLIRQQTYYIRRRRVTHYPEKERGRGDLYWSKEVLVTNGRACLYLFLAWGFSTENSLQRLFLDCKERKRSFPFLLIFFLLLLTLCLREQRSTCQPLNKRNYFYGAVD